MKFKQWLENYTPVSQMTPEQLLKEFDRLTAEWPLYKTKKPSLFMPLQQKIQTVQKKYQELTGQNLDFKFW
jgi:hypothetical protein